jgi:hypothetical protein
MGRNKLGEGAVNLSTYRGTAQEAERLDECLEKLAIGTRSQFFRVVTDRFVEQCERGEWPEWPPRWEMREREEANESNAEAVSKGVRQMNKELNKIHATVVMRGGDPPLLNQLFMIAELTLSALVNELARLEKAGELEVDMSVLRERKPLEDWEQYYRAKTDLVNFERSRR